MAAGLREERKKRVDDSKGKLESASVTLVEGMHFEGRIDGFPAAGERARSRYDSCSSGWPAARRWT